MGPTINPTAQKRLTRFRICIALSFSKSADPFTTPFSRHKKDLALSPEDRGNKDGALSGSFCRLISSGGGADHGCHFRDAISWEAALFGMVANHLFVGSLVHTIDFVARDIAVKPLDLWSQVPKDAAGLLRNRL